MRRLALLVVGTAAVISLLVTIRPDNRPAHRPPAAIAPTHTSPAPATPASSTPTQSPRRYRSGTATALAHTDFGDVRVRVTVAHGRIAQVVALELPHGNPMDVTLSRPAVRTLAREVIQAQSTDVDVVSGATYTSTGYLTSVQAALDRLA
jgi:uncharacterized protein with FMN-binding domain